MELTPHSVLSGWESFYVILGSSAAALTGLQFVVMALIADTSMPRSHETIAAFGTPNVVHFCQALFLASVLTAPWSHFGSLAIPLVMSGVSGFSYALVTLQRSRRQPHYQPVAEDWIWHIILPLTAYAALAGAALTLTRYPVVSLFVIAGMTLVLVFIGIHNAWDTVEYITLQRRNPPSE